MFSFLRTILFIGTFFLVAAISAQNIVRIKVGSLPPNHPANANIFIAGSFNNWNPQNEEYKFQQDDKGMYYYNLKINAGSFEYKLTRGGWDKVECNKQGFIISNRILKVDTDTTVYLSIEEWQDRIQAKPIESTAGKNVHIIDTAFQIPQLKRARRVWIYLPPDFKKIHYPVLYFHDGQNVFDDKTSYAGEWGVDEFMDTTKIRKCIIVGIDNGGNARMNEYNPYNNEQFGKGEGDDYLNFIVKTLKPFIDKKYNTCRDRKNTFIIGSSMGGLISMYAALKYHRVFGGAGIFSPAFWVGSKIYKDIRAKGAKVNDKIYFYAGKQESESMVEDMLKAFDEMAIVSKSKMVAVIRDDGKHNESTWRKEFPLFYKWLMLSKN